MQPVRDFLELIKFEHTVFALPFAYLGMVLAAGGRPATPPVHMRTIASDLPLNQANRTNRMPL